MFTNIHDSEFLHTCLSYEIRPMFFANNFKDLWFLEVIDVCQCARGLTMI